MQVEQKNQLRLHLKFSLDNYLRFWYYRRRLGFCGKKIYFDRKVRILRFPQNISIFNNVVIKEGAQICACNEKAQITIGENTTIGYYTFIFASSKIEIGADCLIAPFAYLVDSDHGIERSQRISQQANISEPISIEDDVWIATGAKILRGVSIGTGAIVAAGALVKEDVMPYQIVGGIPAKVIGERK